MKKETFYKIIPLGILLLWIISGCSKNFLEIAPTDRISQNVLKTDSTLFKAFVINRYIGVRMVWKEGAATGFGRGFEWALWSSLSDETIYNNDDGTWFIQRGQISPENTSIAGAEWGESYRSIRECSWALNNIIDVVMPESSRVKLIAELKFIRAYRYFELIQDYGGIILQNDKVYSLTDDFTDPAIYIKSSIVDCITYVSNELDAAASQLPLQSGSKFWEKGRATKGAALALKSRLLLYAASPLYTGETNDPVKWKMAADAAKAVMDLNIYSLDPDYKGLFLSNNTKESIFSRYYAVGATHLGLERACGPNGYGGYGGNVPLQNLVDAYGMANGKAIDDPTSGYDAQNPYINRDPRFYASILYNGAPFRGRNVETFIPGGLDSKDGPSNWNSSKTGYYIRKFTDEAVSITSPGTAGGLQPWHYLRYAEILLNYSEAQNEVAGPDLSVYSAINAVRKRAGILSNLPDGLSQPAMREQIHRERQVELAFEEHRFYDVRRWMIAPVVDNLPGDGMQITKVGNSFVYKRITALTLRSFATKNYWLPIPREEILSSGGKLVQNEGY